MGSDSNDELGGPPVRPRCARIASAIAPCTIPSMPDIASVLKREIARVARKEVRAETTALKKAVGAYRAQIAALKRRAQALEQDLRRLSRVSANVAQIESNEQTSKALRFSAKGLAAQRQRLGLSVSDCGLLLGTSGQSIYNWESGKVRPQAKYLLAIAALRTMGKREVAARLGSLREAP
jgi:DNA-binding transcriptional regulator YiaG